MWRISQRIVKEFKEGILIPELGRRYFPNLPRQARKEAVYYVIREYMWRQDKR